MIRTFEGYWDDEADALSAKSAIESMTYSYGDTIGLTCTVTQFGRYGKTYYGININYPDDFDTMDEIAGLSLYRPVQVYMSREGIIIG